MNKVAKDYNKTKHSTTKLPPIHALLKKNEDYFYTICSDKRTK